MKWQCKWPVDTKWVEIEAQWGFLAAMEFVKSRFKEQPMVLASLCSAGPSIHKVAVMVDGQVEIFSVEAHLDFDYKVRKDVML